VTEARIEGCILTPRGFVAGVLTHAGNRITGVTGSAIDDARARGEGRVFVLP